MEKIIKMSSGHQLYIHDSPGEFGTIIAVHGLTGNYRQFDHYKQAFQGKYRFIRYDVRGRGNSSSALDDTSIFTHANDLIELIDNLKIKRPILMGYSMGAYISAIVASKRSDIEALILLDGAGEADENSRQLVLPSLKRIERNFKSEQAYVDEVRELYSNLNIHWNENMEEIVKYEIENNGDTWTHKSDSILIKKDFDSFYMFNHEQICSQITCPTFLLIATGKIGNNPPLFQEKAYIKTREAISHIETQYSPVNHYELVFNEQPRIVQQIEAFLKTIEVK